MSTIYDTTYELPDELTDNWQGAEEIEAEANLYWLLKRLPEKEGSVLKLYIKGYTQKEIAEKLGINQSNISRLLKRIKYT